ncbi:MAG: DedA family protein [Candidatus Neomarinimicrobiota bacterium]
MNSIVHFLTTESGWLLYSILFILVFLENSVPLVPGDFILAFSAYLVGLGSLRPYFTYMLTVLAALSGFLFIFIVAHFWGRTFLEKRKFKSLSPRKIAKIDGHFHRFGYWVLAIGRFIPGTRFIIAFMAGFTRLKITPAILYTAVSIVLWNMLIFQLGRLLGENWDVIWAALSEYSNVVNIAALILIAIFIAWRVNKKSKIAENQSSD